MPPPTATVSPSSRNAHPPVASWRLAAPFLLVTAVAGIVAWPLLATDAFARVGARGVGVALAAGGALSLLAARALSPLGAALGAPPGVALVALGAAAAATGERLPLLLVPSWAYGVVAWLFWRSLAGGSSLIERFVQRVHPYAPDFIGPYCRKVTAAWAVFLAASGAALAGLAVAAPLAWWEGFTTWVVLPLVAAGSVVEYLIRKTWFRYYPYGGPVDRLFSAFFPAEATEMGRRSQAYILSRRDSGGAGGEGEC